MQCKTCNYRLWGLRARECPECGTSFAPSQFEFVANSVRFCCPDCGQDYYGTGACGHLVPSAFTCVRCGRPVRMDDMVLFPTAGLQEEQTEPERMPWLDKERVGFFRRWRRTIWMGLFAPLRLMMLTPIDSSVGQAWWFAALSGGVASLGCLLPVMIFPLLILGPGRPLGALGGGGLVILCGLLWPGILIGLWGGVAHAILVVTGRHEAGSGRTYQAMCYSSAASMLCGIPCAGLYLVPVAWVWWSISAILMLRQGQKVGTGRAVVAVLTVPVLLTVSLIGLIVFVAMPGFRSAMQASNAAMQGSNLIFLASSISSYAGAHGGRPPGHASELIATTSAGASMFVGRGWQALSKVPVAGTNLQQFSQSPVSAQVILAQAAAGSLPGNVVAHRLGDFVFTYHGIDFNKADPGLWIVMLAPEGPRARSGPVDVALADGTTTSITPATFTQALATQNTLRRSQGLPPLPDPRPLTHTQPASAP